MGQSMVFNNYGNYAERIRFLRSIGDYLLQKIQLLETKINKRKQQNQQPLNNEITELHGLATQLLQTLAEINVCQYFHLVNEYYNHNDYYYKQICQRYFQDLMLQFNFRLKAKRINQIRRYLIDDDDIDFSISQ